MCHTHSICPSPVPHPLIEGTPVSLPCPLLQDNQQLVEDIKTGFPIPGDLAIEEYRGKENESEIWYETCHQMYPVGVEICILHT